MSARDDIDAALQNVISLFAKRLSAVKFDYHLKSRPDGEYVVFEVANLTDRFYSIINDVNASLDDEHFFKDRVIIQERPKKPGNIFEMPEMMLLKKELTQSLTVHRNTFKQDFFSRYIPSVSNSEDDVVGRANFVVYGRRGAGKSSLLAYAMHTVEKESLPFVWIAMQTYSGRLDVQAIFSVLSEIFSEVRPFAVDVQSIEEFEKLARGLSEEESEQGLSNKLDRLIPRARSLLAGISSYDEPLTIFIDDIHLLDEALQPRLLGVLYSLARDNSVYIKVSGIEPLTRTWDGVNNVGMQSPHDIQVIRLDHNLTMPHLSRDHIKKILDGHARYCGFPSITYMVDDKAISRLVLSAAAVPRDALSLFSQAIVKSSVKKQKSVSITSINSAASESIEDKFRDLELGVNYDKSEIASLLERVKKFCLEDKKITAFLVRIDNASPGYALIQKLAALRFAHVLHEGITPEAAGKRYIALMLDFGFYVGIRTARSLKMFMEEPVVLLAKDLRKLPIFKPDA
jgi:Cdc6-like AAA superfamily ATPase